MLGCWKDIFERLDVNLLNRLCLLEWLDTRLLCRHGGDCGRRTGET
jgi:hypothetical protein